MAERISFSRWWISRELQEGASALLVRGRGDGALLDVDRGLRQQSAVDRCAGEQGDRSLAERGAFEVGRRVEGHGTADLPEDVLRNRATGEHDALAAAHGQVLRN